LSIYQLLKHNHTISLGDSILGGACSGLLSGLIFSLPTAFSVLSISNEQISRLLDKLQLLYPSASQEMNAFMQNHQFKLLFLLMLAFAVIFATIAGILAGMLTRRIYNGKLRAQG
jgi:hypothetical protein